MLSTADRKKLTALFKNLVVLARADREFAPQESKMLARVGKILGFTTEQASGIARNVKQEEFDDALFSSKEELRQLLQFMLFVALADGRISAEEKTYLRRVAVRAGLDKAAFEKLWRQCRHEVELTLRGPAPEKSSLTDVIRGGTRVVGKPVRADVDVAPFTPLTHERGGYLFNGEDPADPHGSGTFLRVPCDCSLARLFLASQKRIPMDITAIADGELYGRPVLRVIKAAVRKTT
ncbi:MAG: TerB family tellurite resistance protein [Planctomycetota bacterium]|nr:TerB family tellurite resistance protein [Planctomycetota bacterium]